MATNSSTSLQRLAGELKSLHQEPVEGFLVTLPSEEDLYTWHVAIFGPPDTPYQGGYFKVWITVLLFIVCCVYCLLLFIVVFRLK